MLHEFLASHREELIQRCRASSLDRGDHPGRAQLQQGIPLFLDQLIGILQIEQMHPGVTIDPLTRADVGAAASVYGRYLLSRGFTLDDVVHDYGDLCQSVMNLAVELDTPLLAKEFRTLNGCLDNAIAHAVNEFCYQQEFVAADQYASAASRRMDAFLDELRNLLGTASLAFSAAKSGGLSVNGATGTILERSLQNISRLIDSAGSGAVTDASDVLDVFALAPFIDEVRGTATLAAQAMGCTLAVQPVDASLAVKGNRDLLYAALISLLQNAAESAQPHTEITLAAYGRADRIQIDVADHGDLPPGATGTLPAPADSGRRGSVGLPIARRFVAVSDGVLSIRDIAGVGCVMTISLPRYAVPT